MKINLIRFLAPACVKTPQYITLVAADLIKLRTLDIYVLSNITWGISGTLIR